jgi:hypothetical protein
LPGEHSDRQPGDRAAESQGGAAPQDGEAPAGARAVARCAERRPSALVLRRAGGARHPAAGCGCWRGKIDQIKTLLRRKTSAAAAAARLLEGKGRR